jgi:hypothetical protein
MRKFGQGETFTKRERDLVLQRIIPAWVLIGCRIGATPELVERCQKAAYYLERLYSDMGYKPGDHEC